MIEKSTNTEILFDLLAKWRDGRVSNSVLRRDLSGLVAHMDFLENRVVALEAENAELKANLEVTERAARALEVIKRAARANSKLLRKYLGFGP